MDRNFKVGDWVFYNFELSLISRMEGQKVTQIRNGTTETSGQDLTESCMPLEMQIKRISDGVDYWYKRILDIRANLNIPDIHRELVRQWVDLCTKKDPEFHAMNDWCRGLIDAATSLREVEYNGIRILR